MVEDQRPKTKEHIYEVHRKIVTVINALENRAKNNLNIQEVRDGYEMV